MSRYMIRLDIAAHAHFIPAEVLSRDARRGGERAQQGSGFINEYVATIDQEYRRM